MRNGERDWDSRNSFVVLPRLSKDSPGSAVVGKNVTCFRQLSTCGAQKNVPFCSPYFSTRHSVRRSTLAVLPAVLHTTPLCCLIHGGRTQYPSKYSTDEVVLRLDFFSASVETVLCMRYPGFLSLCSLIFPNIIQSPLDIVAQFYTTSANILRYAFPGLTILLVIAICGCFRAEVSALEVLTPFEIYTNEEHVRDGCNLVSFERVQPRC